MNPYKKCSIFSADKRKLMWNLPIGDLVNLIYREQLTVIYLPVAHRESSLSVPET